MNGHLFSTMRRLIRTIGKPAGWALVAGIVLLGMMPGVRAQTGTTLGQFLLIEPSAEVAGLGNAGATTRSGAMAAYYNPGALGQLEQSSVQFTHSPWLADITYDYASAAIRLGNNTLMLSLTSLNSGEIDVRTVDQPLGTGERYTVQDFAFGLGYGRRITDRFSAGVQLKYIQESIWHSQATATALDVGVLYELPFRAFLGASISNFGTRGQFDGRDLQIRFDQNPDIFGDNSNLPAALETEDFPLPIFFRVGMGYPMQVGENSTVTVVADAYQPSDASNSVSVGAEWSYADLIALRTGYQNLFLEDGEGGLSFGGGLRYRLSGYDLRFDYAWTDFGDRLGAVQRFSLGFGF